MQRLPQSTKVIKKEANNQFKKQLRRVLKFPMAIGGPTILRGVPMETMSDCTTSVSSAISHF